MIYNGFRIKKIYGGRTKSTQIDVLHNDPEGVVLRCTEPAEVSGAEVAQLWIAPGEDLSVIRGYLNEHRKVFGMCFCGKTRKLSGVECKKPCQKPGRS